MDTDSLTQGTSDSPSAPDQRRSQSHAEAGSSFSFRRVLLGVLVLGLVAGAAAGGWWYFKMREPPLYPVTGVVYLDGEPMADGVVMTQYVENPKLLGGMAGTDENGRFELATNGQPGAYAGEHKITVMLMTGGMPPVSLIPEKYSSGRETPFRVVVDAETQNSPVKLELFGGKKKAARDSGTEPADGPGGGGEDGEPEPGGRPEE